MKINLEKIKNLRKINLFSMLFSWMAEHILFSCLIFFFLALLISFLIFIKCYFVAKSIESEKLNANFILKEDIYNKILKTWQEQDKKIKEAENKQYTDPFENKIPQTATKD